MLSPLKLFLRDRNPAVVAAWRKEFVDCPEVDISEGPIFEGPRASAVLSPANSFGFMDGGIDLAYLNRWPTAQAAFRDALRAERIPFLPVGQCRQLLMDVYDDFMSIIFAPTMFSPGDIRGTINVYLALHSVLWKFKPFGISILCPGMGTGVGQMEPEVAAYQMRMAYQHAIKQAFDPGIDTERARHLERWLKIGGPQLPLIRYDAAVAILRRDELACR